MRTLADEIRRRDDYIDQLWEAIWKHVDADTIERIREELRAVYALEHSAS
jgi:hypothetical protein